MFSVGYEEFVLISSKRELTFIFGSREVTSQYLVGVSLLFMVGPFDHT